MNSNKPIYTHTNSELNDRITELMEDYAKIVEKAKSFGLDIRLFNDSETLELYFHDDYPDTLLVDKHQSSLRRSIRSHGTASDKNEETTPPHWIIDDHGFGGTYYKCSECGAMHWDILDDVDTGSPCPYCDAPLQLGETVYMKDGVIEG